MLPQNPGYANHRSNTPFDPEFALDTVAMAAQRALAAIRRGDMPAAAEFAGYAAVFATDAQRHLAVTA